MFEAYRSYPAIPLSPPSPPADGVKEGSKSHYPDYTPDSPASPFMSVATKSYGPSFAEPQAPSISAAAQRSPSPPTSVPMSAQVSQQPSITATTSFPTPENRVIGQTRKAPNEFDEEHISKRQRVDDESAATHTESGYEAKNSVNISRQEEIIPQAPRQPIPELGEEVARQRQSQQSADEITQPAPVEMSLEQLQKNVGEAFHLCKSAIPRIRPDPSQHLLSQYGLRGLHAKVARTDPVTHEKINRLRRSYEGQIKNFALSGRNKPTKDEIPEGQWSSLNMMMLEPEESWYANKVMGKKIEVTADLEARLGKAMFLQPGRTKSYEHWENLLGHEKPRPAQMQDSAGVKKPISGVTQQRPKLNGNAVLPAAMAQNAGGEAIRPRRAGKKRSYADNSFEGYGDGFMDDEAADMDQSFVSNSEDGSHGPGRKKRKKEHSFGNVTATTTMYAGPSSYGVGGWNDADR